MGKKVGWFSSVKKALNYESKNQKSKRKWFGRHQTNPSNIACSHEETTRDDHVISSSSSSSSLPPPPHHTVEEVPELTPIHSPPLIDQSINQGPELETKTVDSPPFGSPEEHATTKLNKVHDKSIHNYYAVVDRRDGDQRQKEDAYSLALAAAKAAAMAAQVAAEVVRLTSPPLEAHSHDTVKQEIAVIRIQTVFRGYLARRALRALKGLMRLKSLIEGQSVKRQSLTNLRCMQDMSRLQNQVHARRIRMIEENQSLQRQLQHKHEKERDHNTKIGEEWDDSMESKQRIEEKFQNKQEAATRRERAMAYAYSRQQVWRMRNSKSTPKQTSDQVVDHTDNNNNPYWGWNWLERWMSGRPWETRSLTQVEKDHLDHATAIMSCNLSASGDTSSPTTTTTTKGKGQCLPPSRRSLIISKKPAAPRFPSSISNHVNASRRNSTCIGDRKVAKGDLQSDRRRHSIAVTNV